MENTHIESVNDDIARTLTTRTAGGDIYQHHGNMVLEAAAIRMVRTEEGKALRKQYENHEIKHGFNEYRKPELRNDNVANTITTVQKDNYICEKTIPCKLNKMPNGHLDSLDNAEICDIETPTASTITSRYHKGIGAHKDNMCIVAMRGRNPENPSDRTPGIELEQTLEANISGTSNCLTSVQKDNLVLEKVMAIDEQNMNVRTDTFGTLTTDGSSPKHNNRVLIKQATKSGAVECEIGGCFDASYPDSKTRRGRVQGNGNICPALTVQNKEIVRIEEISQVRYRIRKLTPRECGRLMGVSEDDISKMAKVNSNTQLYKQFGNSIVVDVLCAMFRNLNIEQDNKNAR